MAQRDDHPDIQEFIDWVDKNQLPGLTDPNSDIPTSFLPDNLLREYLTANNHRQLKKLLAALFSENDETPSHEEIARYYSKSFCILLLTGKARYIRHFVQYNSLIDVHLPFSTERPPFNFPTDTDDPYFLKRFLERQWMFCAPCFEIRTKTIWEDKRILPIIRKEILDTGGSAKVFKIELQPEYNHLISDQSANAAHKRRTNIFLLKTYYGKDAETYYNKEVAAFSRLTKAEGIIGFYGGWKQDGRYNILLEYADVGTLEAFLRCTVPPDKDSDIIDLWESVFQLLQGLLKIHFEAVPNGAKHPFLGWHQDVKPENILATSFGGEIASPCKYRFKLADLGLSHFKIQDSSTHEVSDQDSQGTRTYGAPECHRSDAFLRQSVLQVRRSVDIWSLGAIYSEVAVWLVRSYKAVQEYRAARREATRSTIAEEDGDCFHDGNTVLPLIREVHQELKSKIRACDYVTANVLEMIQDMLMDATVRPDVKYFWERSQRIIGESRRMCDEKRLPRTTNINSHRLRRPPPSPISESSSTSSVDDITEPVQQPYRPMMYTDRYVTEPKRMNTSTGKDFFSPLMPHTSQRFEHTARDNAHTMSSFPYGPTWQGGKPTAHNGPSNEYQNAANPTPNNDNPGVGLNITVSESTQSPIKLSTGDVPKLSIRDALIWRSRKKRGLHPTLEGHWLLNRVQQRDHAFLIDDSWSMAEYWDKVSDVFSILAYIVKDSGPNGIDLYFAMSPPGERQDGKKTSKLEKVVRDRKPRGKSDIRVPLDSILNDYTGRLGIQKARRRGLARFAPQEKNLRPLTLYVLTDGIWQDSCDAITPIKRLVDRLTELNMDEKQIGIQFISFGYDPRGLARLDFLDSDLNLNLEIVDTTPSTGDIWKMLLGATDKNFGSLPSTPREAERDPFMPDFAQQSASVGATTKRERERMPSSTADLDSRPSPPRHSHDFTEALSGELLAVETMSVASIDDNYNQIIFGNESDAASAESSSGFSSEESKTTAPSTLPSAPVPISKEGSEQAIPPMSFYNHTTSTKPNPLDFDFDIKSITSVDEDLFSTIGSDSSSSALRAAAEDYLVKNLTDDEELLALYQEATLRLDEVRFVRNHTRLLKIYFLDFHSEEQAPSEKLAIRALRSRGERVRISRKIRQVLMPTDSTVREKINISLSQKVDTLFLLNRHLDQQDSIAHSPAVQPPDADNSDAISVVSESSSDDSNNDNEDLDKAASGDLTLPKLESVVAFLTTGPPFKSYKENLRNFLLPKSDPATLQKNAEKVKDDGSTDDYSTNGDIIDKEIIVKSPDLSRENPKAIWKPNSSSSIHLSYRSVKDINKEPHPSENNFNLMRFLSNLYQSFLLQCLAMAEDIGLYERTLSRGFVRLTWDCSCGCCFSQDYPASRLAAAQDFQFKLIQAGYQARIFAWSLEVPDAPVTLHTSNDEKQQHIELPKTPSPLQPYQHIGASTIITDAQSSASGQAAQGPRSEIHLRTRIDHEQTLVKTEESQSRPITSPNAQWLLLCFYHDKYVSKAVHMDIGEDPCDEELLLSVKKEYITARGWATYNLSWTAVSNIRFVRFFLIREDNNSSFDYDVEDDLDEGRENEEENGAKSDLVDLALLHEEWRPPAEWNERDAWAPCPGDERPELHAKWIMHLWNKPHSSSTWLSSKRLQQFCKAKVKLFWTAFNWKRKVKLLWIDFRIFRGMSLSPSASAPNSRDDIESRVLEIPLPPSQQVRARQQGAKTQMKGRFFVENTPKRLEQRLKADLTTPPYGWGLSFEESFVVPVFFKVLISLVVLSVATVVVVVCANLAQKKGYQVFGLGGFTLAVASIIVTVIFKFLI